ncbi:MAG: hypothetical protein RL380_1294 [Verrucomicrobiota bacterium]
MKKLLSILFLWLLFATGTWAQRPASPFGVTAAWETFAGQRVVRVDFDVPPEHALYFERLHFEDAAGRELPVADITAPITAEDKASGHEKKLYDRAFTARVAWTRPLPGNLVVRFQGCSNSACYFPDKRQFALTTNAVAATDATPVTPPVWVKKAPGEISGDEWRTEVAHFKIAGQGTGYLSASEFVAFLNQGVSGILALKSDPLANFKKFGVLATLLLIVLGGLGLNLTPCVLPLIPINLAIIGAGKAAQSRRAGFFYGGIYGLGMALAYGTLGLVVVLTGGRFGTLNSSIWFNLGVAVVFALLSLAMFGLLNLDLTQYENGLGGQVRGLGSRWLVAFGLGGISALLAGACVAPVVISVMLLAANLYGKGVLLGLALPFLLGLGMALPWPFLGASLSLLPKPGKWMVWIKYGFGLLILLFASYYFYLAYGLFHLRHPSTQLSAAPDAANLVIGANQSLAKALQQARAEGKPVLVDFQASWCKNCEAMDATVFNRDHVQRRLKDFVVVKYQAERPGEPPAREVLDYFHVLGLPTYVVLLPEK